MTRSRTLVAAAVVAASTYSMVRGAVPAVQSNQWRAAAPLAESRAGAASALLPDGGVLITGGFGAAGALASAERFDVSGTFSAAAPMSASRADHAAVTLSDGTVFVVGGRGPDGAIASAEVYSADAWSAAGTLSDARWGHTATLLEDGRVLVAGGENADGSISSVEIFDPVTGGFSFAGTLASSRTAHAAVALADGRVVIAGGSEGTQALSSIDVFDPTIGTVSTLPVSLSVPRAGLSATKLLDGKVLFFGGNDGSIDLASGEIFDPAAGTIAPSGSAAIARRDHQAFLLPNNNAVLIVGGMTAAGASASAELFLPWLNQFWATGAMSSARADATGSALSVESYGAIWESDGRLIVAGGQGLASSEEYGFATIKTDRDDYAPGQRVTVSGRGWQAGETVSLHLHEVGTGHPDRIFGAVVDETGSFTNNDFVPDIQHDGVRFYLTARGVAAQARTTFTDRNPQSLTLGTQSPDPVTAGGTASYQVTLLFGGNTEPCTVTLSINGLPSGATYAFSPDAAPSASTPNGPLSVIRTLVITTSIAVPAGNYTFTATGTNGSGCQGPGSLPATGTLVVSTGNSTPIVDVGADATTTEGATFTQSGSFSDPDADSWTATVDYGDGSGVQPLGLSPGKTFSLNHTYADNGTFTAVVKVTDGEDVGTDEVVVTVTNVAPTIALTGDNTVNEGSPYSLTLGSVVDPGADSVSAYTIHWGDGTSQPFGGSPDGQVKTHTYADGPNNYTINVDLQDEDGTYVAAGSKAISVANVAPTASLAAVGPINEGGTSTLSLDSPSDPSTADSVEFHYAFACDGLDASLASTYADASASNTTTCTFDDNGSLTVKGRIFDKDNGFTTYQATVTVNNVAPTAMLANNGPVNEGSPAAITFASPFDPSPTDTTSGFHYAFACDGGSLASATYAGGGTNPSNPCTFPDNGSQTVRARIIDKDDGFTEYTTVVTVQNVAPTVSAGPDAAIEEGASFASSGSFTDPGTDSWTAAVDYGDGSGVQVLTLNPDKTFNFSHAYADNGTFTVAVTVTDDDGGIGTDTVAVIVSNVAPSVNAPTLSPALLFEGSAVTASATFSDPGINDAPFTCTVNYGDGSGPLPGTVSAAACTGPAHVYADNNSFAVTVSVTDKDGGTGGAGSTHAVANVPPVALFAASSPINEGSTSALSLTNPFDPGPVDTAAGFHYSFACDGVTLASSYAAAGTSNAVSCPFSENGTFTVKGRIFDKDNGFTEYAATVAVDNVPPVLESLTTAAFNVPIGSSITIDGEYSDPGTSDSHTCHIDWDDGTSTLPLAGSRDLDDPALGSCSATRTFTQQGVYSINMHVEDDDGGESNTLSVMVTVYDPEGGFVTGGGWILSPSGASALYPDATGKANFGFVSKYKKGSHVPDGQTEFQFKAGDINFHSSTYDLGSLVVASFKAQYKGTGTLNGEPGYTFVVTAYDGQIPGGGGVDKFRIKIVRESDNTVVYDNARGESDDIDLAEPMALGGGSIVIHQGKK